MTTIRDIARLSGYSVSTVSRVINQYPYVAEEKRQEIQKIIDDLDYVPSSIARDLSSGKTRVIGVVLPYGNHPFFTKVVEGIISAAFKTGYKVTLLPTNYEHKLELQYLAQLKTKAFDSLIFTSRSSSLAELQAFEKYGRVVCCENTQQYHIPCVYTNRKQSFIDLFKVLQQRGYRRIGLLLGRQVKVSASSRATVGGYEAVYGKLDTKQIYFDAVTYENGLTAGTYFSQLAQPVDAILANGDEIGAGVFQFYKELKLTPPLIIGQENGIVSRILGMSTIDHHLLELGATAFETAISEKMLKTEIGYHLIDRMTPNQFLNKK